MDVSQIQCHQLAVWWRSFWLKIYAAPKKQVVLVSVGR